MADSSVFATAHSCGLRQTRTAIRKLKDGLCHSAFVRVATSLHLVCLLRIRLCHSAFVRVATMMTGHTQRRFIFATAHSCGLRLAPKRYILGATHFATAHSCGLRRRRKTAANNDATLPQRIRAGCDCGKAMQRTANLLREGR